MDMQSRKGAFDLVKGRTNIEMQMEIEKKGKGRTTRGYMERKTVVDN